VVSKHVGLADTFIKDLVESVKQVETNPAPVKEGKAPIYGLAASFPDRDIIAEMGVTYLDAVLEV
jgi:hypothetical protein